MYIDKPMESNMLEQDLDKNKSGFWTQSLKDTMCKAHDYLSSLQKDDGHWCALFRADTTLPSDYILMMIFLGTVDEEKTQKLYRYIRKEQLEDGGWNIFTGGPSEINATVKAYFACKLSGANADEPFMVKARERIFALGGVEACRSYTCIYLALLGQFDWNGVPIIPVEIMLLPKWFYFNIYEISSWSRAIVIPLAIACDQRPVVTIPKEKGIDELFPKGRPKKLPFVKGKGILSNAFIVLDRLMKWMDRYHLRPFHRMALSHASRWMFQHFERSDGLGAIYPSMVNSIFALKQLGYKAEDPVMQRELKYLKDFEVNESDGTMWIQPCLSPIWDTGLALVAMMETGLSISSEQLEKALQWILEREIRVKGDWSVKNPDTEPSGWAFEYLNDFYPDIDDSFMIIMALKRVLMRHGHILSEVLHLRTEGAIRRAMNWTFEMQGMDGGWASFDRDNNRMIFSKIPFADHNAMLDPSTADITGRALEMMAHFGMDKTHSQAKRAIRFLKKEQEPEGCWYGRWGSNYIYGSWQVLKGLAAIGEDMNQDYCRKAAAWLCNVQNEDGGWGESMISYDERSHMGKGASTPSQTAWALMGLFASGDLDSLHVKRGLQWLMENQNSDGSWDEFPYTGTGFPRVFYIKYEYYKYYFPLFALSYYLNCLSKTDFYRLLHQPAH
ncbi:MAG: squalene--hopene cyclase [Chlamydiota bacterium]|nr:squalene--hopene cyclase [Chlamydiota bacterium]